MSIQKWPRGVVNQSLERKKKEDILEKSGGVKGSPSLFVKDKGKEKKKRKEKESRIVQGNGNLKSHCWVARANSSRAHFFRRQFGLTLTSTSVFFSSFSPGKGKKKKVPRGRSFYDPFAEGYGTNLRQFKFKRDKPRQKERHSGKGEFSII